MIYVVDEELVFDTGFAWAARALKKYLSTRNRKNPIRHVVNSHDHEDHTSNNALFLRSSPVAVLHAHASSMQEIMYPSRRPWYRRFLFGPETPCGVTEIQQTFTLSCGRKLWPIHTPGHSEGHICLWDPQSKALFAGDLYISPTIDTQLQEVNGPSWIQSLEAVIKLEPELLLDGHGIVIRGKQDCRQRLLQKKQFLEALRERVQTASAQGPATLEELTTLVFQENTWIDRASFHEGWMGLITGGDFARSNLVRSFISK